MTKAEIIAMTDRDFREWLLKLAGEYRFIDMKNASKIRFTKKEVENG